MGIIVGENTKVVVQGITGTQGSFHTKLMLDYGTNIIAGVTPGKGGINIHEIPVFDTVEEAVQQHDINSSIIFVPAPFAVDATLEAIAADIKTIVIITEHIPIKDSVQIMAYARRYDVTIVGPNTPGVITPKECKLGIMPNHIFLRGNIGITSRSGTLTYEIATSLSKAGMGQSTCFGLGGDPIIGLNFVDALKMFKNDDQTKAVVLIGEIGGNLEEEAAQYIKSTKYPKPVVAFIAGRTAPPGKKMGHAGAIVMGKAGTAQNKIKTLKTAGVPIANQPSEIVELLKELDY